MKEHVPYHQKLKNPRWQKRRLQIMERDDFACRHCDSKDTTLNVHHAYYEKGKDPWDYEDEMLFTLCEACHERLEYCIKEAAFFMAQSNEKRRLVFNAILAFGARKGAVSLTEAQWRFVCIVGPFVMAMVNHFKDTLSDFKGELETLVVPDPPKPPKDNSKEYITPEEGRNFFAALKAQLRGETPPEGNL